MTFFFFCITNHRRVLTALELFLQIKPGDVDALIMLARFYVQMKINLREVRVMVSSYREHPCSIQAKQTTKRIWYRSIQQSNWCWSVTPVWLISRFTLWDYIILFESLISQNPIRSRVLLQKIVGCYSETWIHSINKRGVILVFLFSLASLNIK